MRLPLPLCEPPDGEGRAWNLGESPSAFVLVDLDLDMDLDIAAAQPGSGTIEVALNDGAGNFVLAGAFPVGPGATLELAAGDIDGDGDTDLVVAGSEPGVLRTMFNDGASFSVGAEFPLAPGPFDGQVFLADVDGDARLDLIVRDQADASVQVRRGDGDGLFGDEIGAVPDPITGRASVVDLSGDGLADLVAPTGEPNVVRAYLGAPMSGFVAVENFITDRELTAALAGDIDQQGHPDVAVVQAADVGGLIQVWLADGDASWSQNPADFLTGSVMIGGLLADVDSNPGADLVAATGGSTVLIALNDGHGGFGCQRLHAVTGDTRPGLLAVGDVDGDGRPDLVAGGAGVPTITVALFK